MILNDNDISPKLKGAERVKISVLSMPDTNHNVKKVKNCLNFKNSLLHEIPKIIPPYPSPFHSQGKSKANGHECCKPSCSIQLLKFWIS